MDSPSKNMYDAFKDEIWTELGPLDPNWFEVLTTQTSADDGNLSDQEELCANQEGNFKTPLDKAAVDSQLFSTPKVFRHSQIVSPETEDEGSFTAEQEKATLPWTTTQSPHLFHLSKQGIPDVKYGGIQPQSQDGFELLHTLHKSPVSYAKTVSESLGAQINPDISWTSSLNTPPAVPSTLILSKTDESPRPVSVSAEKNVVFVRKLFPSLSNVCTVGAAPPKNNDTLVDYQGADSPEAESSDSLQTSLNPSEGVWRQKLPDAIQDGELRSTVASVLEGAENALSIFFTNSSSALRKVKLDRSKRKQIAQTKKHGCSSTDVSTTNVAEEGTADQEPGRVPPSPLGKTGDTGLSQWSPLNLSEIPPSTVDNSILAKHLQSGSGCGQLVRPPMKITDSGFIKKKRQFVYTVGKKPQGKETQPQKMGSSPRSPDSGPQVRIKQLEKSPDEADCCRVGEKVKQKQENLVGGNLPPSVQDKVQDLDMSQLCRDFAQDFSQMSDSGKRSTAADDTPNGFSPSACLSAMKQAKQKVKRAQLHPDCDDVSNRRHVSTADQNYSFHEGTVSDSGFQSAVADVTHTTASSFVLPCSENPGQGRLSSGFKTDIHRAGHLGAEPETKLAATAQRSQLNEKQTLHPGRQSELHINTKSTQLLSSATATVDNVNGQIHGSLPEKAAVCLPSVPASGFKTASNKGIHISSANLERAKHLFEETEGVKTFGEQPNNCSFALKHKTGTANASVKPTTSHSNVQLSLSERSVDNSCQLTASQKADVTELCTLLEEADSQFEFTQFKTENLKQHFQGDATSPQKVHKELDPDFLTGIDFDDSFSQDAEKQMVSVLDAETNSGAVNATSKSTGVTVSSAMKKETSSIEDVPSSSEHITGGSSRLLASDPKNPHRAERCETSNRNPLMLGVAFKTAGGNVLRVSETCLSKARALFADLEENLTDQKWQDEQNGETDAKSQQKCSKDDLKFTLRDNYRTGERIQDCFTNMKESVCSDKQVSNIRDEKAVRSEVDTAVCQSGLHMAGGRGISVSAKHKKQADCFFKDIMDCGNGASVKPKTSTDPVAESVDKTNLSESKNPLVNTRLVAHHTKVPNLNNMEMNSVGFNGPVAFKNAASFHENQFSTSKPFSSRMCTTSTDTDSSVLDESNTGEGFRGASERKVSVSACSLKRPECLLNEVQTLEDTNKQLNQKEDASGTGQLAAQFQVSTSINCGNSGFQTASGKGVTISSAALRKAKSLLSECDEVEDRSGVKPSQSKTPAPRPTATSAGFPAASGKEVALHPQTLQKTKALFSAENQPATGSGKKNLSKPKLPQGVGVNISEESGNGCVEYTSKQVKQKDTVPPQSGGFQTASGRGVVVSSEALKKAQTLFSDCSAVEDKFSVTPSHPKRPVSGPPSRNTGFLAASGKKVGFSSEALQKAKALFSDITSCPETPDVSHTGNCDKKQDHSQNRGKLLSGYTSAGVSVGEQVKQTSTVPPQSGGFQTASGRGVVVSSEALKKAQTLFSDCSAVEDKVGVTPLDSKRPVSGPPSRNTGFVAASGKGVSLSSGALQKAKALFSDITSSPETPDVSTGNGQKKQDLRENTGNAYPSYTSAVVSVGEQVKQTSTVPPQSGGFQTASGRGVVVSSEALKKAQTLFSDCSGVEDKLSVTPSHPKRPVSGPPSRNTGFLAASGKRVSLSSGALQKAKALFSDITSSPDAPDVSHTRNNREELQSGFRTAGGAKVHVSQKNLLKAKHLLKEFDEMHGADAFIQDCDVEANDGIAGKHESVAAVSGSGSEKENHSEWKPDQSVMVNISEVPGNGCTEESRRKDAVPPQNGGFQTASGRGVAVSSEALKKAQSLFSDCVGVEDKAGVTPPHSRIPLPGPPSRNTGFLAASGKKVGFSSEALQKAKALFSHIGLKTGIPAVSDPQKHDKKHEDVQNSTEKIHRGFTTAGGAEVHVSEKSLLKANSLLKEFADGQGHDSHSYSESPCDPRNLNLLKVKDLTTASDKNRFHEDKMTPSVAGSRRDSPGQEMPSVLDDEMIQTSSNKGSKVIGADESSGLTFQSLNLTGCSETQQRFLAQEALDCTKALLEDEGLAAQSLSMTFENMPLQNKTQSSCRSAREAKRRGKRSVEDADLTGQPPLKRRLLDEFDRTVDGPQGPKLAPVKTCPNGVMQDRRIFKYSTSLHPNITRPHSNGRNYVETRFQKTTPTQPSTPGDGRSAQSNKMPAFVPPFVRNAKTEARKETVLKDNMRAPPAFVPPFKKQRTIVQESSCKAQEEEDKHHHHHLSGSPSNSTNTQGATAATSDVMNNESLPAGCGDADVSHVEDTRPRSQDMIQNLENIELARDLQDMRIRKKRRQTIRPLPGSLFLTKTSGVTRIPLKAAVNGKPPARYTQQQLYGYGVHRHVGEISSGTAESFRFSLPQFIKQEVLADGGGVQLADGGWLIPRNDGTAGKEEFYRALCDTPGVDPQLISEAWVYNHYRWIVWKQASMEKSFPGTMGGLCLTPEQLLLQLKYRYDVEVDHSRRPALRKIMEKDDTAAKTLVLCVCDVVSRGHSSDRHSCSDSKTPQGANAKVDTPPSAVVCLTDGWYAVKAQLDEPLTSMLHRGRLAVGGKLIIHGAQLVGSQDACSPLEAPESLMLKVCANSSRPARWDAKLGFHRDPRPFLLPVSSLVSSGGPVGCVDIVILRSYPIQWMERRADGGVVFRSDRAEEKEARRYNSHKQKAVETLFAKIQAEFEKEENGNIKPQRRRRTLRHQNIGSLQDAEELYEAVGDDPAYLEAHLSDQQLETLHRYRRSLMERKQAELQDRCRRALEAEDDGGSCPKRDVTPVWRLCVADSQDQPGRVYQLNLWRPPSDLQSLLKEGCRYKVYNLTTSEGKKRSGVESVQLTGTKKTQFQDRQVSQEWLSARFQPRVSTHFVNLQNPEFQPLCGEVDLTGSVISVVDGQGSSPAFYVADGKLNLVKVRCFSSLSQSGLEDVVKPRVLLALSNLQLRGQSLHPTPVVYAGDLSGFSTNPKELHLQESLSQLRRLVQCQENFFLTAEEKLSHLLRSDGLSSASSPASSTDTRSEPKTSVKPIRNLGSLTPVSRNRPVATSSTEKEKDPKILKRRRALDYLSRIPSPPPLSHLGSVASPRLNKTFNPPRRSGSSSTLKTVQGPVHTPVDSLREDQWVDDEELAMIDTQALCDGGLL